MSERSDGVYPETAKAALARWDAGGPVFTVEMGGIGPGYEQCIQVLVFELIRAQGELPLEEGVYRDWHDAVCHRISREMGGMTGAQVGAAKSLAWHVLAKGWRAVLEEVGTERTIQVSKNWPALQPRDATP